MKKLSNSENQTTLCSISMRLMSKDTPPPNNTLVMALNWRGVVGVVLFKDGEWLDHASKEKITAVFEWIKLESQK